MFSFQGASSSKSNPQFPFWNVPFQNSTVSLFLLSNQNPLTLGFWFVLKFNAWVSLSRDSMKHHFHGVSVNLLISHYAFSILHSVFCILYSAFLEVVGQNGLEPSTSRLSVVCSSQLSYWPISLLLLVESTGIEPVTSCLQGRRSPSWANPPCRRNQIHNARFQAAAKKLNLCLCFSSPIKTRFTDLLIGL